MVIRSDLVTNAYLFKKMKEKGENTLFLTKLLKFRSYKN